jgi:ABC-2 type transport system ATP-binding protein
MRKSWPVGRCAASVRAGTVLVMLHITADGLTKDFGRTRAVNDVSFELRPGRVIGFLGPNGSGKTTTLRMLLGLVRPTAGLALVGGSPYAELPRPGAQVGALLEAGSFDRDRTATNHLRALALERGVRRDRVAEVLALVGLIEAADRRVRSFSLGMRQRLCLAGALLADPQVVILDEPTNGLDPAGIRWLRELLRDLAARGRTVVLSSHLLAEVAQTVDEVIILDRGRLLAHRAISEIPSLEQFFLDLTGPKAVQP